MANNTNVSAIDYGQVTTSSSSGYRPSNMGSGNVESPITDAQRRWRLTTKAVANKRFATVNNKPAATTVSALTRLVIATHGVGEATLAERSHTLSALSGDRNSFSTTIAAELNRIFIENGQDARLTADDVAPHGGLRQPSVDVLLALTSILNIDYEAALAQNLGGYLMPNAAATVGASSFAITVANENEFNYVAAAADVCGYSFGDSLSFAESTTCVFRLRSTTLSTGRPLVINGNVFNDVTMVDDYLETNDKLG